MRVTLSCTLYREDCLFVDDEHSPRSKADLGGCELVEEHVHLQLSVQRRAGHHTDTVDGAHRAGSLHHARIHITIIASGRM